jgi:hypothetical protein
MFGHLVRQFTGEATIKLVEGSRRVIRDAAIWFRPLK